MKLSDVTLERDNYFVAMEYYGLILNRTYLMMVLEGHLIGLIANGLVSAKSHDALLDAIIDPMTVKGDLHNKDSYLNDARLKALANINLLGDELTKSNRQNFRYKLEEISQVWHDPKKKFGMADYPHDGRLYVVAQGKKREFILLGNQSGSGIAARLQAQIAG